MPVSTLRGSLGSTSTLPEGVANEYVGGDIPVTSHAQDRIRASEIFKSAFTHNNVQNLDFNGDLVKRLQSYISGYPAVVTYYRRHVPDQANMSGDTENANATIHVSLDRINDFQLKFSQTLQFAYLSDESVGKVNGVAVTYPGWTPRVGDFFLYAIPDGRMGKFDVTNVQPLSIALSTCHSIDVELVAIVDTTTIQTIETDVVDVFFFNIQHADGVQSTLLHTDEQVLLNDVNIASDRLMRYFAETFFDSVTYHSFVRLDGIYDPYVVQFISKFIPYEYLNARPRQLLRVVPNYNKSYWYFLEVPSETYRERAYGAYTVSQYTCGPRDTDISSLLNRYYVTLVPTDDADGTPYISAGIADLVEGEDEFTQVVRLYLEHNLFNPTMLLSLADSYDDMTDEEKFYRIPVLIYLLYALKISLQNGVINNHLVDTPYEPTRYQFTADNLVTGNILITRIFTSADGTTLNVLGVIDNTGTQHLFAEGEVTYSDEAIHVNFTGLMSRLTLTELTGTWTLVLTGAV